MFEITDSAAEQFRASARAIGDESLSLRISAKKSPVAGMVYNLGFDEVRENDVSCEINGIKVVVDNASVDNVTAMIIDFQEFEGEEQLVFINPNDKKDSCETSPDGCDPESNESCKSCKDEE